MGDDDRHDKLYRQGRTEYGDESEPGTFFHHVYGLFEILFIHSFCCLLCILFVLGNADDADRAQKNADKNINQSAKLCVICVVCVP